MGTSLSDALGPSSSRGMMRSTKAASRRSCASDSADGADGCGGAWAAAVNAATGTMAALAITVRRDISPCFCSDMLAVKQAVIYAARQNVSAERLLQIVPAGGGRQIELGVERVKFQRVVVRQSRGRAGTHVADALRNVFALAHSVRKIGFGGLVRGQTRRGGRNVPGDPMRHVVERLPGMHVAIVKN